MDIKKRNQKTIPGIISPNLRQLTWLDKKVVFRGWEFPLRKIFPPAAVAVFVVILAAYALTFGKSSQAIDQRAALEKEIETLTKQISRIMELPAEERPTLATVTDRSKLKNQDFFSDAQNGDKLLIYPKAKKAILFRPSTGKLVDVSNLTSSEEGKVEPAPEGIFESEAEVVH